MDSEVPNKNQPQPLRHIHDRGDGVITEVITVGVAMIAFAFIYTLINFLLISVHLQGVADQAVRVSSVYLGNNGSLYMRSLLGDQVISNQEGGMDRVSAVWSITQGSIYLDLRFHINGSPSEFFSLLGINTATVHASSLLETTQPSP